MTIIIIIIILWVLLETVFFFTHKHPLNEEQILQVAEKRRKKYNSRYYSFHMTNAAPSDGFKSSLNPSGILYNIDIDLKDIPSYVARLLKGKKHEWVVVAFVKDDKVINLWANKGFDNLSVSLSCDIDWMMNMCKYLKCQSLIRFHNHPNSDPNHFTCLLASDQDKTSARYLSELADMRGINWLDFVCERGDYLEFYRHFSKSSYPGDSDPELVKSENNISEWNNYKLHRERFSIQISNPYNSISSRKKVKNNINTPKIVAVIVLVIVIIFSIGNKNSYNSAGAKKSEEIQIIKESELQTTPVIASKNVSLGDMYWYYDNNPAKAISLYSGNYYLIKGNVICILESDADSYSKLVEMNTFTGDTYGNKTMKMYFNSDEAKKLSSIKEGELVEIIGMSGDKWGYWYNCVIR